MGCVEDSKVYGANGQTFSADESPNIIARVPRDPTDNPILAALIASKAEYLVTGDLDLLSLRHLYPIITPSEFVKKMRPAGKGK